MSTDVSHGTGYYRILYSTTPVLLPVVPVLLFSYTHHDYVYAVLVLVPPALLQRETRDIQYADDVTQNQWRVVTSFWKGMLTFRSLCALRR